MPDVRRRLLTLLRALSLLLCVAVAALCVRSYCVDDTVYWGVVRHPHTQIVAAAANGTVTITWLRGFHSRSGWSWFADTPSSSIETPLTLWGRFGFRCWWDVEPDQRGGQVRLVQFPTWTMVAAFLVLPSRVVLRRCRCRGLQAGTCSRCGYDLRATPGRWPECGAELSGIHSVHPPAGSRV
jgi:hypothetical protein